MAFNKIRENVINWISRFTLAGRTQYSKTALVILHPQSDMCKMGASYSATPETDTVCRRIGRLAPLFRKAAVPIYTVHAVELGEAADKFFGYKPGKDKIFAVVSQKDRLNKIYKEDLDVVIEKLKADNRKEILICGVSLLRDVFDLALQAQKTGAFTKVTVLNDLTANDVQDDQSRKENHWNISEAAAASGIGFTTSGTFLHKSSSKKP